MRIALVAALVLSVASTALCAQAPETLRGEVGGTPAIAQLHGLDADAAAAAFDAALQAATAAADGGAGVACDAGLAALRAAGAPMALFAWGGVTVTGDAPPGMPGWMVGVGFGTPGHPRLPMPLARQGVMASSIAGDPVKLTVIAPTGAEAARIADEVRRVGRHAGRALAEARDDVRLFLEDTRYRPLFDQRSLAGWTPVGGRYDGEAVWEVERGAIVGRTGPAGEGGLLYTEELFTSYALELEVDVEEPFDSGIFVHMLPRAEGELKGAQVTLDNRPGGEIGAIYADGFLAHNEEAKARYRQGEWNHFEVRVTGFDYRIEVWMNGALITDYQLPHDATGYASAGRIGVQVHGGNPGEKRARFRAIRIRELPVFGAPAAGKDGWEALIDDGELAGWERHGVQDGYRVDDGVLAFPRAGDGHLATTEDYRDFRLRLDFKTARMANSGVFLRAARDGSNPAFSGCELQILDDFNWEAVTGSTLKPWQLTGSLYGAVPAGEKRLHPLGEWNTYEILYRGPRLAVALNGRLLYDVDTHALTPESGEPFSARAREGFIGLQAHSPEHVEGDASLWFRDVLVQRL